MALPDARASYEEFTDGLVYFQARLAAGDKTKSLAQRIGEVLAEVKEAHLAHEEARWAELRARARRDFVDGEGDGQVAGFRQELGGVAANDHPTVQGLFPKGIRTVLAPTGAEQAKRLEELLQAIDTESRSARLEIDPKKDRILGLLASGKETVSEALARLRESLSAWLPALTELGQARDTERVKKELAADEAGAVLGALRDVLGGSQSAANSYTRAAPTRRSPAAQGPAAPAGEGGT